MVPTAILEALPLAIVQGLGSSAVLLAAGRLTGGVPARVLFLTSLLPTVKVIVMASCGYILASSRVGVLRSSTRHDVSKLIFYVFLPCFIFVRLGPSVTLASLLRWWFIPVNVALSAALGCAVGLAVCWIFSVPSDLVALTTVLVGIGNQGNMPVTLTSALCQDPHSPFGQSLACQRDATAYVALGMWMAAVIVWGGVHTLLAPPDTWLPSISAPSTPDDPSPDTPFPGLIRSLPSYEQLQRLLLVSSIGGDSSLASQGRERMSRGAKSCNHLHSNLDSQYSSITSPLIAIQETGDIRQHLNPHLIRPLLQSQGRGLLPCEKSLLETPQGLLPPELAHCYSSAAGNIQETPCEQREPRWQDRPTWDGPEWYTREQPQSPVRSALELLEEMSPSWSGCWRSFSWLMWRPIYCLLHHSGLHFPQMILERLNDIVTWMAQALWNILRPPVIAASLAVFCGIQPQLRSILFGREGSLHWLIDIADLFGGALIPCILLVIGGNMAKESNDESKLPRRTELAVVGARLLLMPCLGAGIVLFARHMGFFPSHDRLLTLVLLLQHSMPASVEIGTCCSLHKHGEREASSILFYQHLAGSVTVTLCLFAYLYALFGFS